MGIGERPKWLLGTVTIPLVAACGALCSAGAGAARDPDYKGGESRRFRSRMGHVPFDDGSVTFTRPYNRKTLEELVARASDPQASRVARSDFLPLLIEVIQSSWAPAGDLKEVARPALVRAVEEFAKRAKTETRDERLAEEARRCLWNLDYALAWAELQRLRTEGGDPSKALATTEIERLGKEAIERVEANRPGYVIDLAYWYLQADVETATEKIHRLAQLEKSLQWVHIAQDKLRVRRELKKCENDDQRVAALINAVRDASNSMALRGWAVRSLADHPTETSIKLLFELYDTAKERDLYGLGVEAQEALRRLKKIPEGGRPRYRRVP